LLLRKGYDFSVLSRLRKLLHAFCETAVRLCCASDLLEQGKIVRSIQWLRRNDVVAFLRKGANAMKKVTMALWAAAALAAAGTAVAENPAWTYGQLGYIRADSGDDTTDGFRVEGSLGFAENFHFNADYVDGSIGTTGSDLDFDGYQVGIGAHPSVGASTDVVVELAYYDVSYDAPGGEDDTDGIRLGAGVRHMLADNLEVNALAWWTEGNEDFGTSEEDYSDIALELGGRYLFTDALSAGVTVVTNDSLTSGDSATIDLRYQFGDVL
jgi:hypothetical protein